MECIAAGLVVLFLDLASKRVVASISTPGVPLSLVGNLIWINQTFNPGAAFGLMPGRTWLFLVFTALIVVGGLTWATRCEDRVSRVALGSIMGGALANALDRVVDGYVFDFIDLRVWPVFNLADVAIVAGTAAFSIRLVFSLMGDAGGQPKPYREDKG